MSTGRPALFASDLHGRTERWEKLLELAARRRPPALFLGGDLLPSGLLARVSDGEESFVAGWLVPRFLELRRALGAEAPRVFLIPGNDDPRSEEKALLAGDAAGAWEFLHARRALWEGRLVLGYACVPPTPFLLKDWERYDVSRFLDPGCVSPEEGQRTVPVEAREIQLATIAAELAALAGGDDLAEAVVLFHAPPYRTALDRAALDGVRVDHAPLDVHVGSIAIRRFLEARGPRVSLHGHVHESARLSGAWRDQVGRTHAFGAAHDGPELSVVSFRPEEPEAAFRELF